jgi:uncharacterized protein (TIGR00369 family)
MTTQEASTSLLELPLQPNSRHCFACGLENSFGLKIRFFIAGPGKVVSRYRIPSHFQGYPGVAHGGVVATILDELVGRAIMTQGDGRFRVTARLEVRYRAPVPLDVPLSLMGEVTKVRGRVGQARAELRLPDGTLAAEARATLVDLPQPLAPPEELEALGWRVYPLQQDELEEFNAAS